MPNVYIAEFLIKISDCCRSALVVVRVFSLRIKCMKIETKCCSLCVCVDRVIKGLDVARVNKNHMCGIKS